MKGLSDVVAAMISILVTLSILGAFLAFDHQYISPGAANVPQPKVELLSILWTSVNNGQICIYVYNYGSSNIILSYALVQNYNSPVAVKVYQLVPNGNTYTSNPDSTLTLSPQNIYEVVVPIPAGVQSNNGNYLVTLVTTEGTFFEVVA